MQRLSRSLQLPDVTRLIVTVGTALFIAYLVLTPIVYGLAETFIADGRVSFDAFWRAYSTPGVEAMIWNSVVFAVGSSVLPLVIATFLAYLVVRIRMPYRRLIMAGAVAPIIVPSVLNIVAWTMLASPNVGLINEIARAALSRPIVNLFSMPGMIWVEGTHNVPLAFLFMYVALKSMDSTLEEAALVSGATHWRMLYGVTLPLLRPALAAAALVLAIKSLGSFEVPAILGVPSGIFVFVSRIYFVMQDFPYDVGAAGALSVGLVGLAVFGVWLLRNVQADGRKFQTLTGRGFRQQPMEVGRSKNWLLGAASMYLAIAVVAPLIILLFNSFMPFYQRFRLSALQDFTFDNYLELVSQPLFGRSVWNSVLLGVGSASVIMLVTAIAAWTSLRSRYRWRGLVDQAAFIPIVIPGLVIGLSIAQVYIRNPLPFAVYGTLWILLIAYVTAFLPFGMRYATAALSQISIEMEEVAAISGASWSQTTRRIVGPLIGPGLIAGWVMIAIVAARELGASILLASPGSEVISILMFRLFEDGQLVVVSALGIVLLIAFALSALAARKLFVRAGVGL